MNIDSARVLDSIFSIKGLHAFNFVEHVIDNDDRRFIGCGKLYIRFDTDNERVVSSRPKKSRRYNQLPDVAFEQAVATVPADAAANDEISDDDDSNDDDSVSSLEVEAEAEAVSNDGPDHGYIVDEWLNNGQKVWKIKCRSSLLQMNALPFDRNTEKYDFSGTYKYKGKKFRIKQYDPI